ncbi:hypothetical protein CEXT_350431 [Caerostris extrusa]|uniref:Uncharacterized protein n=1 Tax=Caerostris extrusa TaxID=172846 RepID=A0AAV4Y2U9_CAEEX|nr:hypothetical protein CEXT_350431 [Caerostris extrusa]
MFYYGWCKRSHRPFLVKCLTNTKCLIGHQFTLCFADVSRTTILHRNYRTTILNRNHRTTILNRMVGRKWAVKIHSSRRSGFSDKNDLLLDGHLLLRFILQFRMQ